jgi:hypothetical protein
MSDKIGLIASVLGIIGAIVAFVQCIFKPYFKRRVEFKNICIVVEYSFKRWKELDYSTRGGAMISDEKFLVVNKYRLKFKKKNSEIKAYLFINAIQKGLGGNWGFWLDMNKDNKSIILPLILTLNKSAGLRPAWRSAFILEKIFLRNIDKIDSFVEENEKFHINNNSILDIIKNNKVESELLKISKKGTNEEREKLQYVIEEFEKFSKEINTFTKEQTIINEK